MEDLPASSKVVGPPRQCQTTSDTVGYKIGHVEEGGDVNLNSYIGPIAFMLNVIVVFVYDHLQLIILCVCKC